MNPRSTHRPRILAQVVSLLVVAAAPATAFAKEPARDASAKPIDPAAAQALFYEARALMQKGRYAEACPKLEESLRLDEGIGTAYNLADCNEHIGKIATAWSGFLDVAAQSKSAGQAQRERVARDRAQKLEARLPKLVIDVRAAPPGLAVERDGVAVGAAAFGTPIPVDPGAHKIVATAPGRTTFETKVDAKEATTSRVVVRDLAEIPVAAAPPPPPKAPPAPPSAPTATTTTTSATTAIAPVDTTATSSFPEPVVEQSSTQRTVGWVVLGVGAASALTGGYFGLRSLDRRDASKPHCNGDLCDASGVDLRGQAIRAGNVATVTTIAGGAAILGGIVLVATAPREGRRTGSALPPGPRIGKLTASPEIGPGTAGIVLGGTLP